MPVMSVSEVNYQSPFTPGLWPSEPEVSSWVGVARSPSIFESQATWVEPVIPTSIPRPLPSAENLTLLIDIPGFGVRLEGTVVDLHLTNSYEEVTFEIPVDSGVSAFLTLRNERPSAAGDNLQIREASLNFQASEHLARSHFIANTLYAMLGLSGDVKISIPAINLELGLHFDPATSEIAELLQRRRLYLALMIIEKTTRLSFEIPEYISGEEMGSIFFASRAILEREFIWRVNEIVLPTPANEETLAWIDNLRSTKRQQLVYKMVFGPTPLSRVIFGQEVRLGEQSVFIEDGIIERRQEMREALSRKDNRTVTVRIRPLSRAGRYVFSNGPTVPNDLWDGRIQDFLNLERGLNESLVKKYYELISVAIPELPPEYVWTLINPETIGVLAKQASERQMSMDQYLKNLLEIGDEMRGLSVPSASSDFEFEAAMEVFTEGTEHLPPFSGKYSRADIYFDHD
jgi:hypothetical protein